MRNATYGRTVPRGARPLGVWILTGFAIVYAGIVPIINVFLIPDPNILTMLAAGLGIAVIGAAIGAWQGSDRARLVFMVLMLVYYGLLAYSTFAVVGEAIEASVRSRYLRVGIRSLLWIPIYLWYFLRPKTLAWYRNQ